MCTIFLLLSIICLVIFGVFSVKIYFSYKRTQIITPSRFLAVGVFISSWLLLFPYYYIELFKELDPFPRFWDSVWVTVHHVIRFFVVAVDFKEIQTAGALFGSDLYEYLGIFLIILAPILTFSVILSFWQNFEAYRRLIMHPYAPISVFSELNGKSLALAADMKCQNKKMLLIFTDVFAPDNEDAFDLLEGAKELGAICFKKDMLSLNLKCHSKKSIIYFFAIADKQSARGVYRDVFSNSTPEEENLRQARSIMTDKYYSSRPNTYLFVFCSSTLGEIIFDNLPASAVIARRVDRYSSFIYRTLYSDGKKMLFDTALDNGINEKEINAVIIGAGGYGSEMLKALTWFCQMDGYRLNIDVFDGSCDASERFAFKCPGLMGKNNGNFDSYGIPRYKIAFHNGVDVTTCRFVDELSSIKWPTYILVALGSDELNVSTAVEVRRIFRRLKCPYDPYIDAVVYNRENRLVIEEATKKTVPYNINCIGDLRETFSMKTIVKLDFEQEVLRVGSQWRKSDELSASLYSTDEINATISRFIHRIIRKQLGIPTEEDGGFYLPDILEHRRWMAYMFSEGFVSGTRDHIAKTHHILIPYEDLEELDIFKNKP